MAAPENRFRTAGRKLSRYLEEFQTLADGGVWYFLGFGVLLVLLTPFLALEIAILLLSGADPGWLSAANPEDAPVPGTEHSPASADEVMSLLKPLRAPAWHAVQTSTPGVSSKLGGLPEVPQGFTWPRWKGTPLAFVAQLDLSELGNHTALKELPTSGLLYFFYSQDQSNWGFDPADRGSWHVQYYPENHDLVALAAPADLSIQAIFGEKRVVFRKLSLYPTTDRLQVGLSEISVEAWDEIESRRAAAFEKAPHHQVGGLPDAVQNDTMELECQLASHGIDCRDGSAIDDPRAEALKHGSADWRLLLQIDTDDDIGMMWGDSGMLYFWINTKDIKRRDFCKTWMILQCG